MKEIILITGASGFVGKNVISLFEDKYEIRLLSNTSRKEDSKFVVYTWAELNNIPFDEIDSVIHLAGKAHDVKGTSQAEEYFEVNTELTKKVYDRYLESKTKKFIFLSSVKAVADSLSEPLTEDVEASPIGAYGISKLKAEEYILTHVQDDKNTYILRPCMIHGPGNKGNLNLLYSVIKRRIPYPLGVFENKRSFLSVENLVFVIDKMLTLCPSSGVYNVADDEPLSTKELVDTISESLGYKSRIWFIPKGGINLLAKIGDVIRLPFNTFRLNKLVETYVVDNSKLKNAIKETKLPVSSRDGITDTIKSFRNV